MTASDTLPTPGVYMLHRSGTFVPAVDPVHFDKPVAGVGPGRSFAEAVLDETPGITVGLIPGAVGGSPISSWEPGVLDPATKTYPYDDALERARIAMESGMLKAILWHQGESDSNEEAAPLYKDRLVALIKRLRRELSDPALPFLIGQLGQFDGVEWDAWREMVNDAHVSVAEEMDGVYFVTSEGLGHKGDSLHFSADASREFGQRFAFVYGTRHNY